MNWFKMAYDNQSWWLSKHMKEHRDGNWDPWDFMGWLRQYLSKPDGWEGEDEWLTSASEQEKKDFIEWVKKQSFTTDYPFDNPPYVNMEYMGFTKAMWLVHFAADPASIKSSGFTYGHEDIRGLSYTTWKSKRLERPGYNFAFPVSAREAGAAAVDHRYGKHAVVFFGSGVMIYHNGDEEKQVIFWGPSINKDMIFPIFSDGRDWEARSKDGKALVRGDYPKVAQWVVDNYRMMQNVWR